MRVKKIVALAMTATLSMAMLVGCGNTSKSKEFDLEKYGQDPVITVDGESISFWNANFQARLSQSQYESMYGTDIWEQIIEDGKTLETSVKEVLLEQLQSNRAALNHAEDYKIELTDEEKKSVSAQVDTFLEQITDEFKTLTSPDKEQIEKYLEEAVLIQKISSAVAEEADVTVSDEDARQMKANYVVFQVDADASSSEKAKAKKQATKLMNEAKKTKSLAQSAKASELEVKEATYGNNNEDIPSEIIKASMELKKNEITEPIETEYGYYVIQCMSYEDKDATKTAKEEILAEKQEEYVSATITKWVKAAEITVDEELWNTIKFVNNPTMQSTTETTTEESTTENTESSTKASESTSEKNTSADSTTDSKE